MRQFSQIAVISFFEILIWINYSLNGILRETYYDEFALNYLTDSEKIDQEDKLVGFN